MNPQAGERSHKHFSATKPSNKRNSKFATSSIRHLSRPGFVAGALIALFLLTTSASSIFSPGSVSATTETIATVAADYTTPKASWNLGETSHARIDGAPLPIGITPYVRRVIWVAPDGSVAQIHALDTDPDTDDYSIPSSGGFAQVGTWTVKTIDNRGVGHAFATFTVLSTTAANADLSITKSGPTLITANNDVTYTVTVTNNGPDAAQDVQMKDRLPDNTSFVSENQTSGPTATCATLTLDDVTTTVCSIATLQANESATFMLVYHVGSGVQNGTVIVNGATVSSSTNEVNSADNTASATTLIGNTPPPTPCTINCPTADITHDNDPNQCSAIVSYSTPGLSGPCQDENGDTPPVVCSPPSGSAFPVGSTTVTCASGGTACSFTVTVHDTRPPVQPTMDCPSDVTASEDSPGSGSGIVNYPSPATTGNCVVVLCFPPSGSSFNVGTTTVNCTGTDSANNNVTCHFNVTVVSGNCTLICPGDVTQSASAGQCSAVVNYPAPTISGTCATAVCTPPSGSTFAVGTTSVTCSTSDGVSCSFQVTVVAAAPPTITTCASNKTVSANANCEAAIPNMVGNGTTNTGEVVATGCSVVVSQSPAGGTIVGPGSYTVTITAENSAGEATCTATVTVVESTPPVITSCPAGTSASANANCQAAVPNVTGSVTATDNCTDPGSLTITQSPAAGTLVGVGTTTITITVKDTSNNAATCTTTFTVADTTPPTAVCRNITVALDAGGNASITAANVDNGSSDNCGIVSRTVTPNTFTCANKGPNTVTLTVKDAANNTSTCQATVTVVDNTPPTIACLSDIVADFDPAVNGTVVTYATPVGTDNCPGAVTTQIAGLPSGATFPAGTTTNTFKVTDAGGLTAQCSFKVTVALTSIIGLDSVSITGAALVDSYNSTGGYPATKGSLANVLSNGTITLANSGKVSGNVRSTRAGVAMSGASQVTGNATAGTTVTRSGSATVGGTITNNALAPVMTFPSVPACGPPYSPNTGITGTYSYNPSTGDLSLSGVNIATLANGTYCFHNVTLTNSAQLKVNGLVVIKLTGTLNASGATRFTNTTGTPGNLRILSSYTGTTGVTFGNSTNVHLVIYAPGTGVSISGAAPLFGTVVGKTVTLANSGMIHYDTLLKSIWPEIWSLLP